MKYDIAAKVIIDIAKKDILESFLGIQSESIELLEELPEETASIRRSDFPLLVTRKDGSKTIVILEVQTRFDNDFVLRLIDYTVRFKLKYHLKVEPCVLLLMPSSLATGLYENDVLIFRYNIISLWQQNAVNYIDKFYLYPFLPLMNGGEKIIVEAESRIYQNNEIDKDKKSDILSAMAIFAGLKDKNIGVWLIERRRDIMIESPIYDLIREEGRKIGIEQGIKQGIEQGIEQGRKQGIYDALALVLEIKFGVDGIVLMEKVRKIESLERLETIKEALKIAKDIKEIEKLL